MIKKHIKSSRGTVYYWTNENINSNDTAIVFCHGLTADHTLFDRQVNGLEDRYKIITWDYALHGKSKPYQEAMFDNINKDLLEILSLEAIKKVVLVGQSAGGYIAQSFAATYKELVLGVIGIGTTPLDQSYYKKTELFWIKHFGAIAKLYPYNYYCKLSAKSVAVSDEARINMYNTLERLSKRGMLDATSAIYGEFLKVKDGVELNCPVLITHGEHDKIGYVKGYCREWSERGGYPLKVIKNASHNANYDNPLDFNQILISFVDSL